jgi:hypothetical protein
MKSITDFSLWSLMAFRGVSIPKYGLVELNHSNAFLVSPLKCLLTFSKYSWPIINTLKKPHRGDGGMREIA